METNMLKNLKDALFHSFSGNSSSMSAKSSLQYKDFDMKLSEIKTLKVI